MTKRKWQSLLKRLDVDTNVGDVSPVDKVRLDEFEDGAGVRLPNSYRTYCMIFGAGELGWEFRIAVPGYQGEPIELSLERLNEMARDKDHAEYSPDPQQHERGVFFAWHHGGSYHFFDPEDVTDKSRNEYAVCTLFRDWEVRRTADSFWKFVNDYCLGEKRIELMNTGEPPPQLFKPF